MATSTIPGRPAAVQLVHKTGIPTTATSYSCNWSRYRFLIIEAVYYNNITATIVVPKEYMSVTSSGYRIQLYTQHNTSVYWNIYKNGDSAVYINATAEDTNHGVQIYGVP